MIKETQNFNENTTNTETKIPKRIFIVPYRNRIQQKFFFSKYMKFILENEDDYEIYFSHQCDARNFNRGGTKNIGFLAVKQKYPNDYQNMTFIFNDVDTIPFNKIFDYQTTFGVVKHYYGFTYTLGGIVVMKGADFEMTNGYPNFWGWGNEDNCLQTRCERFGIQIDRSVFYPIGSPEILQLFDGISRIISKKDPWRMKYDDGTDGLSSIHKLYYTIDKESKNPNDNIYSVDDDKTFFVNIATFLTGLRHEQDDYYSYDLREPARKIIHPNKLKKTNKTIVSTDDWRNIPYYSKQQETPSSIAQDNREMAEHISNIEREMHASQIPQEIRQQMQYQMQQLNPRNRPQTAILQTPTNIYSSDYARQIGQRPGAVPSARIGLGGVR
uniref:Galactosyltransferase C-terminal domain-containing protein n=1 Tax=viral metagenome TaxID=1070528 RepID=A0A6C0DTE0_9ZZZZ